MQIKTIRRRIQEFQSLVDTAVRWAEEPDGPALMDVRSARAVARNGRAMAPCLKGASSSSRCGALGGGPTPPDASLCLASCPLGEAPIMEGDGRSFHAAATTPVG